jgi:hypothetical protein
MTPTFKRDAIQQKDSQLTEKPAAHESVREGREKPAPDQLYAIRSFSRIQVKPFVETAKAATEFNESHDDSTARRTGAGQRKTREMRTRTDTTKQDEQSETESGAVRGEGKKPTRENFLPSTAARASGPQSDGRSNPAKQERKRKSSGAVAVAAAAYYYCTVTVRNVRTSTGTSVSSCDGTLGPLILSNQGFRGTVTVRNGGISGVAS